MTRVEAATDAHPVAVRGLSKHFGDRVVLGGIDLEIFRGEFVALLGRSGTGKSTLLRILADLEQPSAGQVAVAGVPAVVFQDARLLPWRRVIDNVTLGLHSRQARQRAEVVLAEVGLADHAQAWPVTLSGGEAQRAALARALVREPQVLLLDEPFGALDALTRIAMHGLLRELCERHRPAVLLVTHDVDEAILLANRIAVLDGGSVVYDTVVDLPATERRSSTLFPRLRADVLTALGVVDADRAAAAAH